MLGMLGVDQERHLVRPEGALDLQAVDDFRSRPALGRPQDDHGPARPSGVVRGSARCFGFCRMSSMAFSRVAAMS